MRLGLIAWLILTVVGICCAQAGETAKVDLRVFYAGHPGSQREADFAGFLRQHFRDVATGDLAGFNGRQADGFDVVLLDYDGDGFKSPRPSLPETYTRPTVTIGVAGAFICSQRQLKIGYT
jgi:hypothetical protein